MIHASKIVTVMQHLGPDNRRKSFDIQFRKLSTGELVTLQGAVLTSYYHREGSLTLRLANDEFRKIRLISIVKLNNREVFL